MTPDSIIVHTCSTLENYAKWTLMQNYQLSVASCNTLAASAYNAIRRDVMGVIGTERSQACVAAVERIMPLALARVFYEYILPVGSRVSSNASICGIQALQVPSEESMYHREAQHVLV